MNVVCILLNQTTNQQVRKVLDDLFLFIKSPEHCSKKSPNSIYPIIRSTGFGNIKARRIIEMSKAWVHGFDKVEDLPGIGKYGKESWDIFVNGKKDFVPTDNKLRSYLEGVNNLN